MKQTLNKISDTVSALFSVVFSSSVQRAAAQNKLTRHIVALNKKSSSKEIINEVAICLKDILGYRLFAFVVKKEAGLDVWLDPRMYKKSLEDIILSDFDIQNIADLNYLNQKFEPGYLFYWSALGKHSIELDFSKVTKPKYQSSSSAI